MKKLLALAPLLAGGAWAGTTLVVGNQSEPAYNDLIAQINLQSPVPFVVESYEKGYLNSTAVTKVMESNAADAAVIVRLKHEMSHSTVAMDDAGARVGKAAVKTTIILGDDLDPDLKEMLAGFSGLPPLEMISHIGVNGAADNTLNINPYKMEKDGDLLESAGAKINFTIDAEQAIKGNGTISPIKAVDQNSNQSIFASEVVDIDFDMKRHESGFYHGSQTYKMASMKAFNEMTGQEAEFSDFLVTSESNFSGDTASGSFKATVGEIKSQLPLNSASMEVSADGLSIAAAKGFKEIQKRIENLPEGDPEAAQKVLSDYAMLLTDMFQAGSSIKYQLVANNDGGTAKSELVMNRIIDAPELTNDTTLGELLMSLRGELTLDADADAINMTPAGFFLQAPPASDFISFDGSKYNSKVNLADNVVDLNGNPFPLDLMVGPYLDMSLADAMSFLQ